MTDWYPGWEWVRTIQGGGSHLLAAGCHAVDALRWCTGLEALEVSAVQTHFTDGYEWPTSILVNARLEGGVLGHVTSSTDFMLPYTFQIEMMGDRATLRQDLLQSHRTRDRSRRARRGEPVSRCLARARGGRRGRPGIRIRTRMPESADVSHHPFQGEMDELVECVIAGRETSINVFDAQKTMEFCLAADRSASQGGAPVALPLISD